MKTKINNLLGLDIGEKKIGLARVNLIARLPQPLAVLKNDSSFLSKLDSLIAAHDTQALIVGLPRNLKGEETAQSVYIRDFVSKNLADYFIIWQDETLSTVAAESKLAQYGVKDKPDMLDAVAACIILEDYLISCE